MPQVLYANVGDDLKPVHIHQSFWDGTGRRIYLHTNGRYAYKDGTPLKDVTELDVIENTLQKEAALRWWKFAGEKESKDYYEAKLAEEKARFGDFQVENAAAGLDVDMITYQRRNRTTNSLSGLHTWREWFSERPNWWGQAESITFSDYVYQMALLDKNGKIVKVTKPGKSETDE